MTSPWRRVAITVVVVAGFSLYLASLAFGWRTPFWLFLVCAAVGLAAIALLSFRPHPKETTAELYSSDAYSDVYLGRSRPTHPHRETRSASQIGEGLPPDPLRLPPA